MKRLWRITRSILRCPLTPVVLCIAVTLDARDLLSQLRYSGTRSTVGNWLQDTFGMERIWGCGGVDFHDEVLVPSSDGGVTIVIGDEQFKYFSEANRWVGTLNYSCNEVKSGFYAPTLSRWHVSIDSWIKEPLDAGAQDRQISGFIDRIRESDEWKYEFPLTDRSRLNELKSAAPTTGLDANSQSRSITIDLPIWGGYARTGLVGAALAGFLISAPWSLCTIPGRVRRWRWKRAGACIHCGYDTTAVPDAPRCPECGTAVYDERTG